VGLLIGIAVAIVVMGFTPTVWINSFTVTVTFAFVLLSIVVLTGYTGQLSLAQFAIAGFGAYLAGRIESSQGIPFWSALIVGVVGTALLGMLFALPAVRTRGINLAIVTLGLGTAVELMLFDNPAYTGGVAGTIVPAANLFGWDMNPIVHPTRYGLFAVALLLLAILAVANVRRGRAGRRLIAVRTNERAAAALGINVPGAKLYAFGLAGAIAAIGGILVAYTTVSLSYTNFTNFTSITYVGLSVIGGLGYLVGPVVGGTLATGGMWTQIFNSIGSGIAKYVPLISGVSVILLVLMNQDGIVKETIGQIRFVRGLLAKRLPRLRPRPKPSMQLPEGRVTRAREHTLEVRRYGRRRFRVAHRSSRADHRADRAQRRGQDIADRRGHRIHADVGQPEVRRPGDLALVAGASSSGRPGPFLPVARAVRRRHRARQPARRVGPA
jgi:sulfate-transporting ATPase